MRHPILTCSTALAALFTASAALAQTFNTNVTIDGKLCVGQSCNPVEGFGAESIKMKAFNLRLKFQDTSGAAGFPTNDWQIEINDSGSGGQERFSVADLDGGTTPFTILGGAPTNSLFVDDDGDVGVGTPNPVTELHVTDGDTPTIRLEQDGTGAFGARIWEVAGNETSFFVRDVNNGNNRPFALRVGAPPNSIFVASDGDVGLGTAGPAANLHVSRAGTDFTTPMLLQGDMDADIPHMIARSTAADGRAEIWLEDINSDSVSDDDTLRMQLDGDVFTIFFNGTDDGLRVRQDGDVEVTGGDLMVSGSISSGGTNLMVPDYVFAPDYELMPLEDVAAFIDANSHLPHIPSAAEVKANGLNLTHMQLAILKTVEELTLHTLAQEARIKALSAELEALRAQ
jgi:hypothetical protein